MAEAIDDLTVAYHEGSEEVVRELDKAVLTRGAWTTILFKYTELDRKTGDFGQTRFTIRRYQKRGDSFIPKSRFNISSVDQAKKIRDTLDGWIAEEEGS
ncbi:hypothetical protein SAMN05660831_00599 [Thiohalospira halophila DSM 15071]|jgi:hypothetical protein|uniref:Uncharacterized protein n=1 Tax=Thiohalospira halophila DSM 15071 TaxID=1123397 RepID=A0A1I1P5H1_9GAMM|nr:hypothetical protein [Thiohalospira halophila]SFD04852.1 hypothetical protein SAMN05660831_00599 [Thiohalospira halophila DSM 15071]